MLNPTIARIPAWARLPIGLLSGIVLFLAFPPVGAAWVLPLGVAGVALATWSARGGVAIVTGLLAGLGFFVPLLNWMTVIGSDAWWALAAFCAGWFALMGWGMSRVSRLPGAPIWIACIWVLQEALRGRIPWGGFPWGNLSFSVPDMPWAASLSWLGAAGTTFALACVGALIAQCIVRLRERSQGVESLRPLAFAAFVLILLSAMPLAPVSAATPVTTRIAIVQGGTPQWGMGAMDVRRAVLDNHVAQTLDLAERIDQGAEPRPDLVLWPENSSDIDPFTDQQAATAITAATRAIGAPILVGAVVAAQVEPPVDGVWNTGLLWGSAGTPEQMYIKTHPVPFGEFIPFRAQVAQLIGRFDRVPRDFLPGDRAGIFTVGDVVVGDVICFEIAYQDVVNDVVNDGAQVITVQTNNATYGGTAQPEQQLFISRARAIEQGRAVVVAATSGISADIARDGTVVAQMGEGETGALVREVPLYEGLTPGHRAGPWLEFLACLAAVAALAWSAVAHRRARRMEPSAAMESPSPTLEQ